MRIGIVGLGNIGSCVLKLLLRNGYENMIMVADIKKPEFITHSTKETLQKSNVIFLCVKPGDLETMLPDITDLSENKLLISCVAGTSIKDFEENLKRQLPIIRCIPNILISKGEGSITFTSNNKVSDKLTKFFYSICGGPLIHYVKNENLIDVSTILTSSMPAFLSHISNEIIEFGHQKGLSRQESKNLFLSSLEGTLKMLKTHTPGEIINKVSTPGGCTEIGIKNFEKSGLKTIISDSLNISFEHITPEKN